MISPAAPERNRGGILSALYLLGYLSMGALALVLGAIATTRGPSFSVDLGAAAIILMNFATLVLTTTTPPYPIPPLLLHPRDHHRNDPLVHISRQGM
jgi:hypothetical protein